MGGGCGGGGGGGHVEMLVLFFLHTEMFVSFSIQR